MNINLEGYNKILNAEKLQLLAESNISNYANASPFPHIVMDDFLEESILDEVLNEFDVAEEKWKEFKSKYEKKFQLHQDKDFGPVTQALIHQLNSATFVHFLEKLTGIDGLIPDPDLVGGGLHKIPVGGKLGIHIDFNQHKKQRTFRRLNVLIYLNKDWKEEYGGCLELWENQKGGDKASVLPIFNRMAMFTTTAKSFHGHPHPLTCPEERSRRSLALYYYTAGESGEQNDNEHSTIFVSADGKLEELGKITFLGRVKRKIKTLIGRK